MKIFSSIQKIVFLWCIDIYVLTPRVNIYGGLNCQPFAFFLSSSRKEPLFALPRLQQRQLYVRSNKRIFARLHDIRPRLMTQHQPALRGPTLMILSLVRARPRLWACVAGCPSIVVGPAGAPDRFLRLGMPSSSFCSFLFEPLSDVFCVRVC